jgi:hypothetical protein
MDKFSSRKFWMCILGAVLATVAFFGTNKITGLEYLTFLFLDVIGYNVPNVFEYWIQFLGIKKGGGQQ